MKVTPWYRQLLHVKVSRAAGLGIWLKGRFDSELDPASYWLAPVHYYWPET